MTRQAHPCCADGDCAKCRRRNLMRETRRARGTRSRITSHPLYGKWEPRHAGHLRDIAHMIVGQGTTYLGPRPLPTCSLDPEAQFAVSLRC
jgi:hypothetical protein